MSAAGLSADLTPLTDDDRFDVIQYLTPISIKWRQIGNALRLSSATLDNLKDGQLEVVIDTIVCKWLAENYDTARHGKPCWDMLVKAVANPAGGDNRRLAEEIAKEHPRPPPPEPTSPPPVPIRTGSTASVQSPVQSPDFHYTKAIPELSQFDWFHGKLSREECDAKMRTYPENCFLVRESASRKDQLTLSLKTQQGLHHFIIKRGVESYEVDGTFRQFASMQELVKHYESHTLTSSEEDKLLTPCPK